MSIPAAGYYSWRADRATTAPYVEGRIIKTILKELKSHAPFTLFGALTGIVLMLVITLARVQARTMEPAFMVLHSVHVFLSAIVTAAMYRRYRRYVIPCVLIGLVGSVGIATLSDIVFPHHGGALMLQLAGAERVPDVHADEEGHEAHVHAAEERHEPHMHLAFIEQWWLILPVALAGVVIGMWRPATRVPHGGHVLLSTWASLFYLTAHLEANWLPLLPLVFVVLFVAVWVPCCVSDIVFPLLFVGKEAVAHEGHHH